jgi:hypothetical protein
MSYYLKNISLYYHITLLKYNTKISRILKSGIKVYSKIPKILFCIVALLKKKGWAWLANHSVFILLYLYGLPCIYNNTPEWILTLSLLIVIIRWLSAVAITVRNTHRRSYRTVGRLCNNIIVGRRHLRALPASPQKRRPVQNMCHKHVIILATAHNDSVCRAYIVLARLFVKPE